MKYPLPHTQFDILRDMNKIPLVFVVVVLLGVVGYFWYTTLQTPIPLSEETTNLENPSATNTTSIGSSEDSRLAAKTYKNDQYGFSFIYPPDAQFFNFFPYDSRIEWTNYSLSFSITDAENAATFKRNDNNCASFTISTKTIDGREITIRDAAGCVSGDMRKENQKASGLSVLISLPDGKVMFVSGSEFGNAVSEMNRVRFFDLLDSFRFAKSI